MEDVEQHNFSIGDLVVRKFAASEDVPMSQRVVFKVIALPSMSNLGNLRLKPAKHIKNDVTTLADPNEVEHYSIIDALASRLKSA